MSKITLGLAGAIGHDPAAALFRDGRLVAAVEEERMLRRRHAKGEHPYLAARQCLQMAGVRAAEVDTVAIPYAPISLFSKARWHYAYRHWYAPDRAIDSLVNGNRRYRRYLKELDQLLEKLHISSTEVNFVPVQHQLAHASSCYQLNENQAKTAIFCNDSKGEYSNIFLGVGEDGAIRRIKEFYNPDSLCGMYAALTDYLGFEILDGEFKVMGISPFGDPEKYDLSPLARFDGKKFKVNNKLVGTVGLRRYKAKKKGHYFSKKLVEMLGPRRVGNLVDDPYVHYAAGIQKLYEDLAVEIVRAYLGDVLQETGRLAIAGTGSMNIRLNQRLASLPEVKELIVHPACSDSGTAIGAAAYALQQQGVTLEPMQSLYLGPSFSSTACVHACKTHREKPGFAIMDDPIEKTTELLADGHLVAWFHGRMEFGSRALGSRSILADPTREGIADLINTKVKFRERWRPFSASVLESHVDELFEDGIRDPYMCMMARMREEYRETYPDLVYSDGATRIQTVKEDMCPDFHRLLTSFRQRTGHALLINTTLNRPGEALACTPEDAIDMFLGTDLDYMMLENVLVTKRQEPDTW